MFDVDRYLERIGLRASQVTPDRDGLNRLHLAHLTHVPFENLDIVFGDGVAHDRSAAVDKIVGRAARDAPPGASPEVSRRGGWCFELNSAFGLLLEALGFDVLLLGGAVLLNGPNVTLDHLVLEVSGGSEHLAPMLVDVGFGDSFDVPLELNNAQAQRGGSSDFQLFASPQGTTLTRLVDDVPEALFRFKRVGHRFDDFAPIAQALQSDQSKHWSTKPFATRAIAGDSFDRVTLTHDQLKLRRAGRVTERHVNAIEWDDLLDEWFGITRSAI